MRKFKKVVTIAMVCMMMSITALPVSASELHEDSACHMHLEDLDEGGHINTLAACDHNGTLKGVTYIGTCSKCGGFLYYVYCKVCGKYTGATVCLCR